MVNRREHGCRYSELSWDVVEPVTYFTSQLWAILGYCYFLVSPPRMSRAAVQPRQHAAFQDWILKETAAGRLGNDTFSSMSCEMKGLHHLAGLGHHLDASLWSSVYREYGWQVS